MPSNAELVRDAITRLFVQRDVTVLGEHWSDSYLQHNPQLRDGTADLAAAIQSVPVNFSYEMGPIASDGDLVMVHGRYVGLAPTPVIAVDIFRILNGKIAEHWDVLQEEVPADQTASGRPMFPAG